MNGFIWCEHVLRRDDDSVLKVALDFEVSGKKSEDGRRRLESSR